MGGKLQLFRFLPRVLGRCPLTTWYSWRRTVSWTASGQIWRWIASECPHCRDPRLRGCQWWAHPPWLIGSVLSSEPTSGTRTCSASASLLSWRRPLRFLRGFMGTLWPSVCALTLERFNFSNFCFRKWILWDKSEIKFEDGPCGQFLNE